MKKFFVWTLASLFATTCLLTNLPAEWDRDHGYALGGDIYGYAYVSTGFNFPFATSYHHAFVRNNYVRAVKFYCEMEATVSGPSRIFPKSSDDEGWVPINDGFDFADDYFRFNMRNKEPGRYTITGDTDLTVKVDLNGDGDFDAFPGWDASCSTTFRIE